MVCFIILNFVEPRYRIQRCEAQPGRILDENPFGAGSKQRKLPVDRANRAKHNSIHLNFIFQKFVCYSFGTCKTNNPIRTDNKMKVQPTRLTQPRHVVVTLRVYTRRPMDAMTIPAVWLRTWSTSREDSATGKSEWPTWRFRRIISRFVRPSRVPGRTRFWTEEFFFVINLKSNFPSSFFRTIIHRRNNGRVSVTLVAPWVSPKTADSLNRTPVRDTAEKRWWCVFRGIRRETMILRKLEFEWKKNETHCVIRSPVWPVQYPGSNIMFRPNVLQARIQNLFTEPSPPSWSKHYISPNKNNSWFLHVIQIWTNSVWKYFYSFYTCYKSQRFY